MKPGSRILIGVHHFPPHHVGGAEWRAHRTARHLLAQGFDVRVVAVEHVDRGPRGGVTYSDETYDGVPVRRLAFDRRLLADNFVAEYRNEWLGAHLTELMHAWTPALFHLISGYLLTGSALEAAYSAHVPAVISLTDFYFLCRRLTLWRSDGQLSTVPPDARTCARCLAEERPRVRWLARKLPAASAWFWRLQTRWGERFTARQTYLMPLLAQAGALISPSRFLAETLIAAGAPRETMVVLRQGHDLLGGPAIAAGWTPSHRLRLAYAGQISEHKGLHVLVEAIRLVPDLDLSLAIYGDPDRFPDYAARVHRLAGDDPRISWRGAFRGTDALLAAMAEADVSVVPSVWYENSPNTILEAFACGRPVVASRLGGMAELVTDGVNGLTFPAGDAAALADRLRRLVSEPEVLPRLRSGIPAVKTVADEVAELLNVYRAVTRTGPSLKSVAVGGL
jgi:glycosyltransferase involved in cell wall biosynthesis